MRNWRALSADHPAETELHLSQAKAAYNLIKDLGAGEPAATRALYKELRALSADHHPAEPELQEIVTSAETALPQV